MRYESKNMSRNRPLTVRIRPLAEASAHDYFLDTDEGFENVAPLVPSWGVFDSLEVVIADCCTRVRDLSTAQEKVLTPFSVRPAEDGP